MRSLSESGTCQILWGVPLNRSANLGAGRFLGIRGGGLRRRVHDLIQRGGGNESGTFNFIRVLLTEEAFNLKFVFGLNVEQRG